ncbi:MAG: RagB/SusD family nutrient uptake outer membrane protein, partial [Mongoliibacter sp.]|uniref:RagB/SusD family nutrient uptake outer membrane protein n=1 Tax=Mongoliibacter sp. TaxID=2022438 RepID=UPI0012F14E7F
NRGQEGLGILNELLISRYKEGTFEPILYESKEQALSVILEERRKSLVFRGYSRWTDLRRFLREPDWNGPSGRTVMGETYDLGLDPSNYYLQIPINEIELNPAL